MARNGEMSFLEHLEALRWHLIRSFVAVLVITILAFIFKDFLFDQVIFAPSSPDFWTNKAINQLATYLDMPALKINETPIKLQNISMSGQFSTHLWVAFLAGIIVAFPYVFWELWRFIRPALHENEARSSQGAILIVSLLFVLGVLFGYYVIAPMSISFLVGYQVSTKVENIVALDSYISTVSSIVLSSGVLFELPVFIYFLAKIGVVSSQFLKKYRRHAIVVIVILAAIITPPDVVSQTMVCLPLLILYEASIMVAKRLERKRKNA
ncbi:MAG: twin-arginine translocase subunit TatC [Breznakibacter sp.]